MKVSDAAILVSPTRTALTVNLLRLEILCAIECDQQMSIPMLIRLQPPRLKAAYTLKNTSNNPTASTSSNRVRI